MNYLKAFLVGGAFCIFTQVMAQITKKKVVWILTFAFCVGIVLSASGLMSCISEFGRSGIYLLLYGGGDAAYQGMSAIMKGDAGPLLQYILLIVYCELIGAVGGCCAYWIKHK